MTRPVPVLSHGGAMTIATGARDAAGETDVRVGAGIANPFRRVVWKAATGSARIPTTAHGQCPPPGKCGHEPPSRHADNPEIACAGEARGTGGIHRTVRPVSGIDAPAPP